MPYAGILHGDDASGVGLEGVACIELAESIGADDLPVGATRRDGPLDFGPLESSAQDRNDAARAARQLAHFKWRTDFDAHLERKYETRSGPRHREISR